MRSRVYETVERPSVCLPAAASIQIYFGGVGRECGPHWGRGLGREHSPSPENYFDFGSQNGDLWCILGAIFSSSAKTLRGRKDTLAQVYFYWGEAIAPSLPPGSTPLSVGLSHRSTSAAACGGFAAECPAGKRYRSIAAARRSAAYAGSVVLTAEAEHRLDNNGVTR